MASTPSPKTIPELLKLVARHGKRAHFVSGSDSAPERSSTSKVSIDVGAVGALNEIETVRDRVSIGTGISLGRLGREATGENGLLRQAASLLANPLVRNRITLIQALDPESSYFDITTALVLLDAKVRLQSPAGKRTVSIKDYLASLEKGLKKGEIPTAIDYTALPADERVGFFRVARASGKGTVSAAARMKLVRGVCSDPEIVVSSLSLIPIRSHRAETEIDGKPAGEEPIKRASQVAADEIQELSGSKAAYERSLIEIVVGRILRDIIAV